MTTALDKTEYATRALLLRRNLAAQNRATGELTRDTREERARPAEGRKRRDPFAIPTILIASLHDPLAILHTNPAIPVTFATPLLLL